MPVVYVAMTDHYWGVGDSVDAAKRQAKKAGASERVNAKGKWLVKKMPPGSKDIYVDQMGDIVWTWEEGADRSGKTEIVERPLQS